MRNVNTCGCGFESSEDTPRKGRGGVYCAVMKKVINLLYIKTNKYRSETFYLLHRINSYEFRHLAKEL